MADDSLRLQVVEGLLEHARPVMLSGWVRPDSCIAMSRLAIEVFEYFQVPARAYRMTVIAANKVFMDLLEEDKIQMDEPLPDWAVDQGAWALGMGNPKDGLHITAVAGNVLIDLSLDQASRPAKGLGLEPSAFQINSSQFLQGREPVLYPANEEGGVLIYYCHPQDTDFKWRSPDWTDFHKRYKVPTGEVIRKIRTDIFG